MKLYLILIFLFPCAISAQLRFDTLENRYKYQCNCNESLIVRGTPVDMNFKSKYKTVSVFRVLLDTTYYGTDTLSRIDKSVYIFSNDIQTAKKILSSNLFVLRNCLYCESQNLVKCRPRNYYEIIEAVNEESKTLQIIERNERTMPCVRCQAQAITRNKRQRNFDIQELDYIEKFIVTKRRKRSARRVE